MNPFYSFGHPLPFAASDRRLSTAYLRRWSDVTRFSMRCKRDKNSPKASAAAALRKERRPRSVRVEKQFFLSCCVILVVWPTCVTARWDRTSRTHICREQRASGQVHQLFTLLDLSNATTYSRIDIIFIKRKTRAMNSHKSEQGL